jgi:hypothetical protein
MQARELLGIMTCRLEAVVALPTHGNRHHSISEIGTAWIPDRRELT